MDAEIIACAPSGLGWQSIKWVAVARQVKKLQARIVKATLSTRWCYRVPQGAFAEA